MHPALKLAFSVLLSASTLSTVIFSPASAVLAGCPNTSFDTLVSTLKPGDHLVIPAGCVVYQNGVVEIGVDNVMVSGGGTVVATDLLNSSVFLKGNNITVSSLTFKLADKGSRQVAYEQMRIRVAGRNNTVSNAVIDGSSAAGVYVGSAVGFKVVDSQVFNTNADGIHVTEGSHSGVVAGNKVSGSGDDGVSVVSYKNGVDHPVSGVVIKRNVVSDQKWGRGFSVVGGRNILLKGNKSVRSAGAALYIAAESEYDTFGVDRVVVDGFVATESNLQNNPDPGLRPSSDKPVVWHGAIHFYDSSPSGSISRVKIKGLRVSGTSLGVPDVVARVYDQDFLKKCKIVSSEKLSVSFQRFSSSHKLLKFGSGLKVRSAQQR